MLSVLEREFCKEIWKDPRTRRFGRFGSLLRHRRHDEANGDELDDQINITLGCSYDFQFMKLYGLAQHFMNATTAGHKSAQEQNS